MFPWLRLIRVGLGLIGAPRVDLARKQQAFPVVGDAIAKFRRDLKVFQSFEIHTRFLGWNEKWGFIEHRFVRHRRNFPSGRTAFSRAANF